MLTICDGVSNAPNENPPKKTRLGVLVMVFFEGCVAVYNFIFDAVLLVQNAVVGLNVEAFNESIALRDAYEL